MAFTILVILVLLLVAFFICMNILLFGINIPVPSFIGPAIGVILNLLVVSTIVFLFTEH